MPEKVEVKPRTKLSFIAPRLPVNRNPGFVTADVPSTSGVSAGGLKITSLAAGGQPMATSAAFSANNAFSTALQDQAVDLQQNLTANMTGYNEIQTAIQARHREM